MISIRSFPIQRMYWMGVIKPNVWMDLLGCEELTVTVYDLCPGDSLEMYGSNISTLPKPNQGFQLGKVITKNGEFKYVGHRWYMIELIRAENQPVDNTLTIHFLGKN
jgi:hypothetical protein